MAGAKGEFQLTTGGVLQATEILDAVAAGCFLIFFSALFRRHRLARKANPNPAPSRVRSTFWTLLIVVVGGAVLSIWPGALTESLGPKIVGTVAIVLATGWLAWSYSTLGMSFSVDPPLVPSAELKVDGPFRYVRNPIYSGMLVGLLGYAIAICWILIVVAAALLRQAVRQIRAEESALRAHFGQKYDDYCDETVSRLFPGDHRVWK